MTLVRILWWVMGHVGYHFAFSIICFHVGKWSLQLLWQLYCRNLFQGSHIPFVFQRIFIEWAQWSIMVQMFPISPKREYLATIAPYQSNPICNIYPYHPLLPFTGPLPHLSIFFYHLSPPKASCSKKIPRFPWTLRFCQWLLKENPLDFSSATFAAYVAQLMREAGRAKVRHILKTRQKGRFLNLTKTTRIPWLQFLID